MVNVSIDILDFWRATDQMPAWKVVTFLQCWFSLPPFYQGAFQETYTQIHGTLKRNPSKKWATIMFYPAWLPCLGLPWWVAFTNSTIQEILVWSPVHLSTNQVCFRTQCYLSSVRYEPGCDFGSCCFCSCFCFLFLCFLLLCWWEKKNLKSHTLAADPATHHSLLVALPLKASLPRWLIRSWSHPQVKHNLVISTQIEKNMFVNLDHFRRYEC